MRTLITGISGFVGGDLARAMQERSEEIVGLSREPGAVDVGVPVVKGDAVSGEGLDEALDGVEVAYYFVHSFESGHEEGFASRDRRAAENFAAAAEKAGVRRIVYLGAIKPEDGRLSPHLRSRGEVEEIIRSATPASLALCASLVLSAHNHVLRFQIRLVEKMPVLTRSPSSANRMQPIDGRDLTACLLAAATWEGASGQSIDVAGREALSYGQFFERLAAELGLEREVVETPPLDPDAVAPELAKLTGGDPALIGPILGTSQVGDTVARNDGAAALGVTPRSFQDSLAWVVEEHRGAARPLSEGTRP